MKIKAILDKVLKGETLTDEEKKFLGEYDEQKLLDAAAGAARKKAEGERDQHKAKVDELTKALEEAQKSGASQNDDLAKLNKRIADLEKANKESADKLAAQARTAAIQNAVREAKITCAKGISSALFDNAVSAAFSGIDMNNAEVVKSTLEKFKTDNPALIAVEGIGGPGQQGGPGAAGGYDKPNPFSKKSLNMTEALTLMKNNPALAKQLQADAAKEPQT